MGARRTVADNPVDWRPWSDDAFEEARRRGVPVLLSVVVLVQRGPLDVQMAGFELCHGGFLQWKSLTRARLSVVGCAN